MVTTTPAVPAVTERALRSALSAVTDPELPVLTLTELGILRGLETDPASRHARVRITPTYSGCPALEVMQEALTYAATSRGWTLEVTVELHPAWSSDDITPAGRRALATAGIAPPEHGHSRGPVAVALGSSPGASRLTVGCPLCGAEATEVLSEFGATACKQLRRCLACREPFEAVKGH